MLIKAEQSPQQSLSKVMKELAKGSSDSRHPFRYATLASYNPDEQEPNIRMLILREVAGDGTITMYTDARTSKFAELQAHMNSALLFWHDYHKVQVTFKAETKIHHSDEVAEHYWKKDVHGAAQKAYTPLVAPGTSITEPGEAHSWPDDFHNEHFCVIKCMPYELEILQLAGKKHLRLKYTRSEANADWEGGWIAP